MNTAAEVQTFGNPDLPESTPDRPLVTFALFAYNQEQYIREAVEGAFSQTYEPLVIILSDDCSSDQTFEIMQEMAGAYEGPHKVEVRRSSINRGTLGHVLDVAQESNGKYIVVAAGDDISMPTRTQTLACLLEENDAAVVSSAERVIDRNGHIKELYAEINTRSRGTTWGVCLSRIFGATAAYRSDFLRRLSVCPSGILIEDAVFEIIAHFTNQRVTYTTQRLVKYRHHSYNISVREVESIEPHEVLICNKFQREGEAAAFAYSEVTRLVGESNSTEVIHSYSSFLGVAHDWRKMKFIRKMQLLAKVPDRAMLEWFLPRAILPWSVLKLLKQFRQLLRGRPVV